jgi:hypothetical protein
MADHRAMITGRHPVAALRLDIELGSDPLRGSLTGPGGPAIAFAGWIELASVLEAIHHSCIETLGADPDD